MKKRVEKQKIMVSIIKNPYCIGLENAEKRTAGISGQSMEGYSNPRSHPLFR